MTRRGRDIALVLGVLLAALLFNERLPITDRDEARYAVTSRAMLDGGDWVVPRMLGRVRTAKPPGVYWLQAASLASFGESVWAVRLPGALCVTAAAAALRFGLAPTVGRRRAWWTALATATSVLGLGVAKVGVIDGPLLLCASVAFAAILRLLPRPRCMATRSRWAWWWLWLAVGASILLKGPVLVATTILGLGVFLMSEPRLLRPALQRLKPTRGLGVALLVALPWAVLVTLREPSFLPTALGHDVLGRATRGLESHGQPPGFHLLLLPATFFPWSLLLPGALVAAWPRRRLTWVRWCLFGTLGGWLVLEANATKLPHYPLVLFPPLALLVADWIVRARAGRRPRDVRRLPIAGAIVLLVAIGFAAASVALADSVPWLFLTVATGWGVVALLLSVRRRVRAFAAATAVGFALTVVAAYGGWASGLPMLHTSPRLAEVLGEAGAAGPVAMVEYKEPSLAWYAGQRGIAVFEAPPAALGDPAARWAVVPRAALAASGEADAWEAVGAVETRLYNDGGRPAAILVVRRR